LRDPAAGEINVICNTYEISGSVRNPALWQSPLAQFGKNRPTMKIGRMRAASPDLVSYPEVAHHG